MSDRIPDPSIEHAPHLLLIARRQPLRVLELEIRDCLVVDKSLPTPDFWIVR